MPVKKDSGDSINWRQISVLVLALIVLSVVALAVLTYSPYRFTENQSGVLFGSNDSPVKDHLKAFSENARFLVAVDFREGGGVANPYLANAASLFLVVLIGNEKSVTSVYRLTDESGNLLYCRSNLGDVLKDERLEISACQSLVSDFAGGVVEISWPDSKRSQNEVVLAGESMRIATKDFESLSSVSFRVLTRMYPNAPQILNAVNDLAGRVQ